VTEMNCAVFESIPDIPHMSRESAARPRASGANRRLVRRFDERIWAWVESGAACPAS
jgi:hypothetical protein